MGEAGLRSLDVLCVFSERFAPVVRIEKTMAPGQWLMCTPRLKHFAHLDRPVVYKGEY